MAILEREDAMALAEAILEGREPTYAHVVREIRYESGLDLKTSSMFAKVVLRSLMEKGNKQAMEIIQRLDTR